MTPNHMTLVEDHGDESFMPHLIDHLCSDDEARAAFERFVEEHCGPAVDAWNAELHGDEYQAPECDLGRPFGSLRVPA